MAQLDIQLLGSFQVLKKGQTLTAFRTDKIRALLVYLAAESDRPHRRDSLAALLWPEMPDRKALYNLRLSLHRLRETLGDAGDLLVTDRQSVRLAAERIWVDVSVFEQTISDAARHSHVRVDLCPTCMARIETAMTYYQGDFLPGFFFQDDLAFSEWASIRRERLHAQALQCLIWLANFCRENGHPVQAIPHVRRQLALEPWLESAHRELMALLAQTKQHSAALHQYDRCASVLYEELGVEPSVETVQLYKKIRREGESFRGDEQARLSPANLASIMRPAGVPSADGPFVGRDAEMAALDSLLADPDVRLVTIVGIGGLGKTRVAQAIAAAQAKYGPERFADGVCYISMASVTQVEQILPAIAQAMAYAPGGTAEAMVMTMAEDDAFLSYLQARQMLLVLDNFEQLLATEQRSSSIALLSTLIQRAPTIKLLLTSRQRLAMRGEHPFPLGGLAYPMADEISQDQISVDDYPAMQFFRQRARRLLPDYAIAPADVRDLAILCLMLDGMPLGLELAAAWTQAMPLSQIVAELGADLDFLAAQTDEWPDRHRNMRRVFDDSWQRLDPAEQALLATVSCCQGGFTRGAAQAIAARDLDNRSVLRLLASLVGKSLLKYDRMADRYTMHELLRQYCADHLSRQPDHQKAPRRHATYFCRWLARQRANLKGARQQETLRRIAADLENIRIAWLWAVQAGEPSLLIDACFGLGIFFLRHGRRAEGLALFGETSRRLADERTGDIHAFASALVRYWQAVFEPVIARRLYCLTCSETLLNRVSLSPEVIGADKAAVLLELAIAGRSQGDHMTADRQLIQSLSLYQMVGDRWGEANVQYECGVRSWRAGDYAQSDNWFSQCLTLRRDLGDSNGIATALEGLAGTRMYAGDTEAALRYLEESGAAFAQLGDGSGAARIQIKHAQIEWRHELKGLERFEAGLAALSALGARYNVALWTTVLAMFLADVEIDRAERKAQEGLALCRQLGHQRGIAIAKGVLGRVALVKGENQAAYDLSQAYLAAMRALSLSVEVSDALIWAGWACLALGEHRQAERYVADVLQQENYWRIASIDLAAVLLATSSADEYPWAWQLLGYAERHYARHRGAVSQEILLRFLPQSMCEMPHDEIARLKARGRQLDDKTIYARLSILGG